MTATRADLETKLRTGFKAFNRLMLLMWRLGMGRWVNFWPAGVGRIMVLTHIGRKSGLRRRTPLNYAVVDGDVYCTAGFGAVSDWYRNIVTHPQVEVWLPDGWWTGTAEDVTGEANALALLRQVLIASAFAGRAAGINPHTLSDEEMAAITADYRLVRIRRTAACTGPGGPGDLAWVWPVLVMVLALQLRRQTRSRS